MKANEIHLSQQDCACFQTLILDRTGMFFGPRRTGALRRGVLNMIGKNGFKDLKEYYRHLMVTETDSELWDGLVDELTVGETYFFRDAAQIDVLRYHILPDLISRHRHDRRLRIWSAGCASGEEPYTIAILLCEALQDLNKWNILILGTDINKQALQRARKGIFRKWSFRQTDPLLQSRYFKRTGDTFELNPSVREMATFMYVNLSNDCYPSLSTNTNAMDLILCRNVAIYQSETVVQEVVSRFRQCMMPGGWLVVGASETSIPVYGQFASRIFSGITVFQKMTEPPSGVPAEPGIKRSIHLPQDSPMRPPIRPLPPDTPEKLPEIIRLKKARAAEIPPLRGDDPVRLYAEGEELLKEKRFEEALNAFQACLALDPGFPKAIFQVACVYANLGRLEEARLWCTRALKSDPLLVAAHYTLALIYQEEGDLKEAAIRLKKALFLEPQFALAHFSLAILYVQKGNKTGAARHKRQVLRIASLMLPEAIMPGSDDLTARQLQSMVRAMR